MYFYLDKKMAKQNIARCLYKSDNLLTDEELKIVREHFNFYDEFLIYEGEDIPYPIKYNSELDTIEEVIVEEPIQTFSENISESVQEEIFGDEDGKTHWYINKEKAINKGLSETFMTSDKPLLDMYKYFGNKNVIHHIGNEIPHFVTYDIEKDILREATDFEKYKRGQKQLSENEVVLENKKEIITITDGQYVNENEEIITVPCLEEYLQREWDKTNHIWKDLTTDLDRVQAQYREYEGMDTPSTVQEMKLQDEALATEYLNMMIELRGLIYTLKAQEVQLFTEKIVLPKPSKELLNFKNNFKLLKK